MLALIFSRRQPTFTIFGLLTLLLITGCGTSKTAECNKIIDVVNKAAIETEANQKKGEIARLEEVANNLSTVQLKDQKLKEFQTRFIESYRARQQILAERVAQHNSTQSTLSNRRSPVDDAARSRNLEAVRQSEAELTVELGKGQVLEQEFTAYCKGK